MKILEEWSIKVPWGNIALASWGDRQGKPVLLVHGRQDSLSTFLPLLQYLPERYYYVAMDLPGNGKSDPLPTGVMITRLQGVSAIEFVLRHLKWHDLVYIGHSMGAELGLFYSAIYPGKISKLVLLDVKPGLQRLQMTDLKSYFNTFHLEYYSKYGVYNEDDRRYTGDEALRAVMKARGMTRDHAQVLLDRNLRNDGGDKFKLSWDKRQRILAPLNLPPEYYIELFSKSMPPTLFVNAKQSSGKFYDQGRDAVNRICAELNRRVQGLCTVEVEGGHDVHFTNPELVQRDICSFLNRNFKFRSKI